MANELKQAQKEIVNVPVDKKTQSEDAVTIRSFGDDGDFTVIASISGSTSNSLEHSISTAVTNLLEHLGFNKKVDVTIGSFQLELSAKDELTNQ